MRSLLFALYFYLGTALWALVILILGLIFGARMARRLILGYCRWTIFGLRWICNIRVEVRGAELLARDDAYLIVAKHMSDLDPIITYTMAPNLTALAKKELFAIPLIGQILKLINVIRIDRQAGNAHQQMPQVIRQIKQGRHPLIVYPEGTRSRVGERKKLKSGAYHLQETGELDVITVATNSGVHWPKGTIRKRPGVVVAEIHGPLPKGLPKDAFMAQVAANVLDRSEVIMAEVDGISPPAVDEQADAAVAGVKDK